MPDLDDVEDLTEDDGWFLVADEIPAPNEVVFVYSEDHDSFGIAKIRIQARQTVWESDYDGSVLKPFPTHWRKAVKPKRLTRPNNLNITTHLGRAS